MPYRIDLKAPASDALDRLVELGALDVDALDDGIAALMPDTVTSRQVARALGVKKVNVSRAVGRDTDSVWILTPRSLTIGRLRINPAHSAPVAGAVRLHDSGAFGTGLHPTTALCLELLDEMLDGPVVGAVLDVGAGSGILALAALALGVERADAIDVDGEAVQATRDNARLNGMDDRLAVGRGGPDTIAGVWPLVFANILAAPLIEMAPTLIRRVGHHGRLVLSGIPESTGGEVERTYRHLGMRQLDMRSRGGWIALVMRATW